MTHSSERLEPEIAAEPSSPSPQSGGESGGSGDCAGRTMAVLNQIQTGRLDPSCIGVADRRLLVANLMADGYATAEIAQILKVSDRSIERDRKAIRESNAVPKDPRLIEQMVGRLVGEAELSVQRIRRAIRGKEAPHAVRVEAEHRCYQIVSDLVGSLQRLGYLPTASQRVEADLTHHVGELPGFEELQIEVQRIKQITAQPGSTVPTEVLLLEERLTRADLAARVASLAMDAEAPAPAADAPGDDDDEGN